MENVTANKARLYENIEVGEDSIPIWLEQENQTALDVRKGDE